MSIELAKFIPWLPFLSAILCTICCMKKSLRGFAAPICIASIFGAFLIAVGISAEVKAFAASNDAKTGIVTFWNWIQTGTFHVGMSYYIDPLTVLMLFVVTGIGTLVAIYASGYMKGDKGYARFFAAVSLFIFAMTSLVMADNLVLLYLGWEGVGLCSFMLIGYYYEKPSAVAAAKKAFIVNRIGDLGFALGIFMIWMRYDTVSLSEVVSLCQKDMAAGVAATSADLWIPFLLMLGAFGKSAQLPLYVWLPDAMEGPTPVSALIHAATMVTAGVYMIARLFPLFEYSPAALPTVAIVGGCTALFAATIALCQYDIKRIYAYSTISQLGYMFLGVGAASTVGGVFHLFTHAFFKALLFLTAGSVMHALAGQLDLRKMSGLRHKMPVTCWLMFLGCLALAGFPFTAGFFSKDMILADVMSRAYVDHDGHLHMTTNLFFWLAMLGLFTAFLTAYYTFRLWFRVFMGPENYVMGEENHAAEEHGAHAAPAATAHDHGHDHSHDAHGHDDHAAHGHAHAPHEMPWLMNAPLLVLAVGAVAAGFLCKGWVTGQVNTSTAAMHVHAGDHHAMLLGMDVHTAFAIISSIISVLGISIAAYFHWFNRPAADKLAGKFPGLVRTLENKWYVDDLNDKIIVKPLRLLGEICFAFDRLIIDPLVGLVGFVPRAFGMVTRPAQGGVLQAYGMSMVLGVAIVLAIVVWKMNA